MEDLIAIACVPTDLDTVRSVMQTALGVASRPDQGVEYFDGDFEVSFSS